METYKEMNSRQRKEFNAFPIGAAFNKEQLRQALVNLGLDPESGTNDIVSIGAGCFIRKSDIPAYKEMTARHAAEREAAINADETGEGFIYGMFCYELANHEYCYTGDPEETLEALGLTWEDIEKSQALRHGLKLACEACKDEI